MMCYRHLWVLAWLSQTISFSSTYRLGRVSAARSVLATKHGIERRDAVVGLLPIFLPVVSNAIETESIEMKLFQDPLFELEVPQGFFTLRRSAKGDLPDAKTGKGRRGSSIFTAGNMAKAEVIAVERFPTRVLLEDNGIEASGNLRTFPDLGEASAIANLLLIRREKDQQAMINTSIVPDSLVLSADGRDLSFRLRTEIEAQKPELLMEEYGVSQLFRITTAKATLRSNDGMMMAVFASALEKDMPTDGPALERSVLSFQAKDQAST